MKKNILYNIILSAVATAIISACTLSESITDGETDSSTETTLYKGYTYMSVALATGGGASATRATSSYSEGEDYENVISADKSIFLLYDKNGEYLTFGTMATELTWSTGSNDVYKYATVVLNNSTQKPDKMVAILNYSNLDDYKGKNLDEIVEVMSSDTPTGSTDEGGFLMSNAVRYVDGALVFAADVEEENFCESEEDSAEEPVAVYVEREISKVAISSSLNRNADNDYYVELTEDYPYCTSDDITTAKIKVVVDGWTVNATNPSGYVIKNYDDTWEITSDWYDTTDGSCYRFLWAKDANYELSGSDCYDIATETGTGCFEGLEYTTWNSASTTSTATAYYHENTASKEVQDTYAVAKAQTCVSSVLLTAHLEMQASGDEAYTNYEDSAIYYCTGVFYTLGGVKNKIASDLNSLGYRWRTGGEDSEYTYSTLSWEDISTLTFAKLKADNTGRVTVTECIFTNDDYDTMVLHTDEGDTEMNIDSSIVTLSSDEASEDVEVMAKGTRSAIVETQYNEDLLEAINNTTLFYVDDEDYGGLACFSGGACYYQVPITHLTITDDDGEEFTYNGLVRNHSYKINISGITSIGWAVYDKDEPLVTIPGEEDDFYVQASLNILQWIESSQQDVTF